MRVCIEYDLALDSTKNPTKEREREREEQVTSARKLKVVRAKFKVEHVQ